MGVEGGSGGVEGGGVAGAASVSGAAILGMPSFEAAPVVVNEGPVRSLEGFRPMNISDITTIDKGGTIAPTQPLVIAQAEEVAAAAWEKSELPTPEQAVSQAEVIVSQVTNFPNVIPANAGIQLKIQLKERLLDPRLRGDDRNAVVIPQVEPAPALQASPALESAAKTATKPAAKASFQVSPAFLPQPVLQEQEVEEKVEEKVKVDEPKDSLEEEEQIENIKRKFVVDGSALSQVVIELKDAARKAGVLAAKLGIKITGKLIGSFLPGQHQGNESEAVKGKGPDGSIPERQQTIEEQGEYISVIQAEADTVQVAYEKPPIKIRPEGESVKPEVVEIVFRGHIAKPKVVAEEIVRKRIVKKVQVLAGPVAVESKPETNETSLKDYPELEAVFGKAA